MSVKSIFFLFCLVAIIFCFVLPVCALVSFQVMSLPQAPIVKLTTKMGQRLCPGWDGNDFKCGKFMSHSEVDPHTLCGFCRLKKYGRQCDPPSITCRQCIEWPEEQIDVYRRKGTYRKRKSESPHGSTPSPVEKDDGHGFLAPSLD